MLFRIAFLSTVWNHRWTSYVIKNKTALAEALYWNKRKLPVLPDSSGIKFYQRLFLKKSVILSNGITSVLSYKSVWTAPGIIISSLLPA